MHGSPHCLHHVDLARLRAAYWAIRPQAAPGIDGVTWDAYGAGSGDEPLGSAPTASAGALPGKSVSKGVHPEGGRAATAARHRHVGGQDRPTGRRRGAQRHLRGGLPRLLLRVPARAQPASMRSMRSRSGSERKKVNWVLDADIRDFFSSLDHDWLEKFLEHRIGGQEGPAAHPQMGERRSHRGRELVG